MIAPRWRKVLYDLWGNKVRTMLVVLSIAIGIFAVGFVNSSFIILLGDMDADYQSVNPHAAIIYCQDFTDDLVASLRQVPGVGEVEGRSGITARLEIKPGKKVTMGITAISSVEGMKIDRIRPANEAEPIQLNDHEILIERTGLAAYPMKVGDMIPLELPSGRIRQIRVSGIIHDVTSIPYAFTNQMTAFVTPHTLEWLEGSPDYNQVYLTVAENPKDVKHVTEVAQAVADKIKKSGRDVYFIFIYQPGRHFASDISQALGMMMSLLGALAVLLSGFLVINTINSLLSQHIRQIGVMKAVGGHTSQIVGMYLVLVLCFGIIALLVAVPPSLFLGYATSVTMSNFLNFKPGPFRAPLQTIFLQSGVALIVPVLAALVPVLNGSRITIREAIGSYGLGKGRFGKHWIDRLLEKIRGLPRPLLISLRNTFRRKARLALTLSTLALGGGIFMAVFNNGDSLDLAMQETMGYFLSDVNITLNRPARIQKLESLVKDIPGVVRLEGWGIVNAQLLSKDKQTAEDIAIIAPPVNSSLFKPVINAGRWVTPEDGNAIIIGNHVLKKRPDLKVGDVIVTKIDEKEYTWHIVGIFRVVGNMNPPLVYTSYESLDKAVNLNGMVSSLRIITTSSDIATQDQVVKAIDAKFKQAGSIQVADINTGTTFLEQQKATTSVLTQFLLIMAILIAFVGGLGLMGTMSMNVMERTREIGVMRAIGASDWSILQMVIIEGMLIGTISWILAVILAQPITYALNYGIGSSMLAAPLDYTFSLTGLLAWLTGVLVISALASALPARNASRLTIREVLVYE